MVELTILVDTELQQDGHYFIGYRATSSIGGTFSYSATANIHVDRTPLGAAVLAPIIFPNAKRHPKYNPRS